MAFILKPIKLGEEGGRETMKSTKKSPYVIIEELIEDWSFGEWGLVLKHMDQIFNLELEADAENNVVFSLERHPHLFGRTSRGKASTAYATVTQIFQVNLKSKDIKLLEEKASDINIDYYGLANEDVESVFESGFPEQEDKLQLVAIDSKKAIKILAESLFKNYDWESSYESNYHELLPKDFKSKLMDTIKDEFVSQVADLWKRDKKYWIEELEDED
jgi:hypothetical protein